MCGLMGGTNGRALSCDRLEQHDINAFHLPLLSIIVALSIWTIEHDLNMHVIDIGLHLLNHAHDKNMNKTITQCDTHTL